MGKFNIFEILKNILFTKKSTSKSGLSINTYILSTNDFTLSITLSSNFVNNL